MSFIGDKKLVIIDEAQRVKNIGLTIKLLVDTKPALQIIATGSSAFDLANKIAEPLTGRTYEFRLYPVSLAELSAVYSSLELNRLRERFMIYGLYPEVVIEPSQAETLLRSITTSYLYKDALEYQHLKQPEILQKLLEALALQIGNEVSYNELANLVGVDKITVASYIRILEQAFVIYRLPPLSRNVRKELGKLRKIYFYDLGIRNSLIKNLNLLSLRQDTGVLWENFIINERIKMLENAGISVNHYFWRTLSQQKIDLVEEHRGKLSAFEIKWGEKIKSPPRQWHVLYPQASFTTINQNNYLNFLTKR